MIISSSSPKGGAGKTTVLIFVNKILSEDKDKKILLIDFDPQNSLTFHFMNVYKKELDENAYDVSKFLVSQGSDFSPIILEEKLHLISSSPMLASQRTIAINVLKNIIEKNGINLMYDYILIDTAPSYDNFFLTVNNAADVILYPLYVRDNFDIKTFLSTITLLQNDGLENIINKIKIVFNKYHFTKEEEERVNSLVFHFGKKNFLETKIPYSVKITRAVNNNSLDALYAETFVNVYKSIVSEIL